MSNLHLFFNMKLNQYQRVRYNCPCHLQNEIFLHFEEISPIQCHIIVRDKIIQTLNLKRSKLNALNTVQSLRHLY